MKAWLKRSFHEAVAEVKTLPKWALELDAAMKANADRTRVTTDNRLDAQRMHEDPAV